MRELAIEYLRKHAKSPLGMKIDYSKIGDELLLESCLSWAVVNYLQAMRKHRAYVRSTK